ncbi:MAG: LamG-like jellyroll fold domain-containing protein [Kiritimatiellia bacterium]|nr:LamG-like jellyroll fold domain-containing protein [Kiritimatiellia bacterium]
MNKWWLIIVLLVATAGLIMWPRGKRQAEVVEKSPYHTPREIKPHVPAKPPVFYLAFEETNRPSGSIMVEAIEEQDTGYTEGIKGKALVIGRGKVNYKLAEKQPARPQGTIGLWIKPIAWDDESYLDFISMLVKTDRGWTTGFRIYRPFHTNLGLVALKQEQGQPNISLNYHVSRVAAWQKNDGPWHQVVYVWDGAKGVMYVDGLEIQTNHGTGDPLREAKAIQIGNVALKYNRDASGNEITRRTTAIDEVAIYDYAWSAEEVQQNFEQWMGRLEDGDDF